MRSNLARETCVVTAATRNVCRSACQKTVSGFTESFCDGLLPLPRRLCFGCICLSVFASIQKPMKLIKERSNCIHRIASGGYYGFDFVTPTPPPPQCVERFHRYRSNEKNIIASLLKFAGYIHSHKILPGNIFGLILKNKMAATGVFRL